MDWAFVSEIASDLVCGLTDDLGIPLRECADLKTKIGMVG
jgi:hypothetical protein